MQPTMKGIVTTNFKQQWWNIANENGGVTRRPRWNRLVEVVMFTINKYYVYSSMLVTAVFADQVCDV